MCLVLSAAAQQPSGIAAVRAAFVEPPADSRIMMRWWWFGPSVTHDETAAEMRRMKEGGIGGFEIAIVYPMAVDDPASRPAQLSLSLAGVPRRDRVHRA